MNTNLMTTHCTLDTASANLLKAAMERLNLSARAYDRILRVSRTIADLAGTEKIRAEHVAESIQYRSLDREGWGG
jgi:magnesium chelatase family protein